ncbi:hypothetical protein AB1K84_16755 [Mesobacillus foraminis]|uniref:Uncharacterized protein n=1 Tax=Mesobacillus foraminis TaxID=279826 RepID=A0A4R2BFZ1_9BACI|nr:hypothetical protein [Mesobacillus foraminis]TCN24869.1 hypothetical protein EV146_10668 [Mesobacillus foraminis]
MNEPYKFSFFITEVETAEKGLNEKIAVVETSCVHPQAGKTAGIIRVRFNDFGIFPNPEDIAAFTSQLSLRRALAAEIKRYIKPQKPFL